MYLNSYTLHGVQQQETKTSPELRTGPFFILHPRSPHAASSGAPIPNGVFVRQWGYFSLSCVHAHHLKSFFSFGRIFAGLCFHCFRPGRRVGNVQRIWMQADSGNKLLKCSCRGNVGWVFEKGCGVYNKRSYSLLKMCCLFCRPVRLHPDLIVEAIHKSPFNISHDD